MNKANFQQAGGFRLEVDTLTFMQNAYTQLSKFSGLGGQTYILDGCVVDGGNVSNGTVVIDGEILPFVGGAKLARIIIEEIVSERPFENGGSKEVYYTRSVKMVAAGGIMDFDSLKRVSNLLALADRIKDQEVIKWTPVSDNTSIVLGTHDCWMLKMGRMVVFSGSFYFTNTNPATQNSVQIKGMPAIGNIVTAQYGYTLVRNAENMDEASNRTVFRNSNDQYLSFLVSAPTSTRWSVDFSITLFTV